MGMFSSGAGDYNRELKAQRDRALGMLSFDAVSGEYGRYNEMMAPMMAQMATASQVGANMDTQALQGNLARQGLGQTGIGAALGSGMRTGATMQSNMLRARMAQEMFNAARQQQGIKAQTVMQQALGMQPDQGAGAYWMDKSLQAAGVGVQAAGLMGMGGGSPQPFDDGGVPYRY